MAEVSQSHNDVCYFAMTNFRGQNRKFGIRTDDRRRHMYVIGKTGMGKSTLLENMIVQDIREGRGVGVVDPLGDLAEKIIDFIPPERINDVIYLNPADVDYPLAFNILENVDIRYKHLVASGLMGVFTKIWANVWSARMEYILSNCILALLDSPGNTLLGINRMLVDKSYRHKIVSRITDPVVRSFWVNEYANYSDKYRTEAIAPIQNKVGQFLSTAIVRNIVGQTKSTIDLREIMDNRKVLIMNLSKGRIGEDNSALLGAMMITKLQVAAMSRVDVPEPEREDFFLYVDEFQNFATMSFKDILSEARKYRLSLIMAHQYIEQLDEEVAAAVFGNVGTIACYRVGATDAEDLVKEFTPYFTEEDLVNLTKFEIYLRLMINGVASKPFSASSLPPLREDEKTGNKDKVIAVSRERFSRPRAEVEEKIIRWTGIEEMGADIAEDMNTSGVPEEEARYREGHALLPESAGRTAVGEQQPELKRNEDQRHVNGAPRAATGLPAAALRVAPPRISAPPVNDHARPAPRPSAASAQVLPPSSPAPEKAPKEATCDYCGKGTLVVFMPDEKRNVFCKKCLKLFKKGLIDVTKLKKRNVQETYEHMPVLVAKPQEAQIGAVRTQEQDGALLSAGGHAASPNFIARLAEEYALPAPLVATALPSAPRPSLASAPSMPSAARAASAAPSAATAQDTTPSLSLHDAMRQTPQPFHAPRRPQGTARPAASRSPSSGTPRTTAAPAMRPAARTHAPSEPAAAPPVRRSSPGDEDNKAALSPQEGAAAPPHTGFIRGIHPGQRVSFHPQGSD